MPISGPQVAMLHAYLVQDADGIKILNEQLRASNDTNGFAEFVWAAFILAARRRFAPEWTVPDVVKYVAAVRARRTQREDDFDPRAAEVLLRRALGDTVKADLAELARGRVQVLLLAELITDEGLDKSADLGEFLAGARALGDQMIRDLSDDG